MTLYLFAHQSKNAQNDSYNIVFFLVLLMVFYLTLEKLFIFALMFSVIIMMCNLIKVNGKHFYFTTVTAKLELVGWPLTFRYYPQLSWYLLIRLGELEHVDFKENMFKALTQVKSGVRVNSNPRPVDP